MRVKLGIFLFVVVPALGVRSADPVRFSQQGHVIIDGRPRLIIGLYELPADDGKLHEIAASGINLIRVPASRDALDRIHRHDLLGWISLGSQLALPEGDEAAAAQLTATVKTVMDHPALLCWEAPDEALWNVWHGRMNWVFRGQRAALLEQIAGRRASTRPEKFKAWNTSLARAQDFCRRGLWKESEEVYDSLWEELGITNPQPEWKMSLAAGAARKLGDELTRGWQLVRSLDSAHVLWQNHAPRNSLESLRLFNRSVDAAGCDIYPAPFNSGTRHSDLADINLTAVGRYTDRMRQGAPGKAVWMVLQGFGWRSLSQKPREDKNWGRQPNYGEIRFMAYDAILHGSAAILYWGTHTIKNKNESSLWHDLMRVAREIRALEPALTADPPPVKPLAVAEETYGSVDGQGPLLMLRKDGDEWVLIAANEIDQGVAFQVQGLPGELEGKTLYRLYTTDEEDPSETRTVKNGSFRDGIRSLDVHVYATSHSFENW